MPNKKSKRNKKDIKTMENLFSKFGDETPEFERIGNESVENRNAAEAVEEYVKIFGANKNDYRVIPRLNDGLKPGAGRLLYSWWLTEGRPQNTKPETMKKLQFAKASEISSVAMRLHPHSDTANADLLVRMGQPWKNNVMLIVPQGSFGNQRGDQAANGRYSEVKIGEFTIDCFFSDFDKYSVPMKPSYSGRLMEPEYLPAKYPYLLFNPQFSGIGYGLSSNIPPFNVKEVLEATIKLMKDPNAKIMLIPDCPNGCDIIDTGDFKEMNKTGIGKLVMQSSYEIDYNNNIIHFTTVPLRQDTKTIIKKIADLQKTKVIDGISDIRDNTQEEFVDFSIRLNKDTNPDKILKTLFKKTDLRSTLGIGITVVDDYEPIEGLGIKELLLKWIDYRRDIVRGMLLNTLRQTLEREHTNKILIRIFDKDNIDKTIKISRESKSRQDMIQSYMKTYDITSLQAASIADMRVSDFNKNSYQKFKDAEKELKEKIDTLEDQLEHDEKLDDFIIKQLEYGIEKYGRPRQSKIIRIDEEDKEDIPDTNHLIGISSSGYIKKISLNKNTTMIGRVGKDNGNIMVTSVNNRDDIIVTDSTGKVSKLSISALPNMEYEDAGIPVSQYFKVEGTVEGMLKAPSMKSLKTKDDEMSILFVTKNGYMVRTPIEKFAKLTTPKTAVKLTDGDEVVSSIFILEDKKADVVIYTNKGNGVRINLKDIKTSGLNTKGITVITLSDDEYVAGASIVDAKKNLFFYITSSGRAKITEAKYFPQMKKKDSALSLLSLDTKDELVGVSSVNKDDVVICYKRDSEPETIEISDMKVSTRIAKAEKILSVKRGDSVVAYKVLSK